MTASLPTLRAAGPKAAAHLEVARSALAAAAAIAALVAVAVWALTLADYERATRTVALAAMILLALAALWFGWRLARQAAEAGASLRRFAHRMGLDDPQSELDAPRDSLLATSTLDAVASGVEQALGVREWRWKARARLSADWYWETDDQLRISWLSEDLKSPLKLGLRREDLIGRRYDEVIHFSAPEGGWDAFHERMAQRKSLRDVEVAVHRPGRSPLWMVLSARPRRNAQGHFAGYAGVGRDITEQRLAFQRLHDSERRYAVMADLSADWYWETDAEHRVTSFGPLAHELLGELAARAIGQPHWVTHAGGASDEAWARHRADLDARRSFRGFEFVIRRPGRGAVWVAIGGVPRHDAKGTFIGYHGVGRDITLRKRAEKVLITRNAQLERLVADRTTELEQSNRDLEAFSRQLAHELRTPINHVVGFAELLHTRAWDRLTTEEREWLRLSAQSGRAMSGTVTALLELARSGSAPLVREAVDLSAMARALVAELPPIERRAAVDWQIEPELAAHCSEPLARVVLTNLLGNAAKFTRDVEAPWVQFGLQDDGGQHVFFVADNGAGFDPRRVSQLFQPFARLHATDQFSGTGVGLSIVRRIVERHGGWVLASAAPGAGARFEFTLATRPVAGDEGESTDDEARSSA